MIRKTSDFYDHKYSALDSLLGKDKMTKTAQTHGIEVSEGTGAEMHAGTGIQPHGIVEQYGPVARPVRSEDMFDMIKENLDAIDVPEFEGLGSEHGFESLEDALNKDEDTMGDDEDFEAILEELKSKASSLEGSAKGLEKKEMDELGDVIDVEIDEADEGEYDKHEEREMDLLKQWLAMESQEKQAAIKRKMNKVAQEDYEGSDLDNWEDEQVFQDEQMDRDSSDSDHDWEDEEGNDDWREDEDAMRGEWESEGRPSGRDEDFNPHEDIEDYIKYKKDTHGSNDGSSKVVMAKKIRIAKKK